MRINKRFVGSYQRNILLDAKSADAFYNPKLLESVWAFQQGMESVSGVGAVASVLLTLFVECIG